MADGSSASGCRRSGIALELYAHHRRHYLLASAHPQHARVHLVARKPSRGVELPTPLLLLLRKYVQGGRLVALEQPALERLLLLSIVKDMRPRNHDVAERAEYNTEDTNADLAEDTNTSLDPPTEADLFRCELIIEPMERRSNILLVNDANVIMDSVKRVTPAMSQRVVLPQQPYVLPPAQDKRDPRSATAAGITAMLAAGPPQTVLAKALVQTYRGVSPQAAREVAQRACGNAQITLSDALAVAETAAATLAACYVRCTSHWIPARGNHRWCAARPMRPICRVPMPHTPSPIWLAHTRKPQSVLRSQPSTSRVRS